MYAVFIINNRESKTTSIQSSSSSQIILRQEGVKQGHPYIRGHRKIPGHMCLVIHEVTPSMVDRGKSEQSSWNTAFIFFI
jgi:hypothetical protein